MQIEKLRATVSELEQQLQSLGTVDDASRQRLQDAVREIRAAINEEGETQATSPTLVGRLKDSVEKFEVSHPTLTSVLGRLIDILGQMGI